MLEVRETRRTIRQVKGPPIEERRLSFKLHPKLPALASLSKHLGLYKETGGVTEDTIKSLIGSIYAVLEKFVPPTKLEPGVIEMARALDGAYQQPPEIPAKTRSA